MALALIRCRHALALALLAWAPATPALERIAVRIGALQAAPLGRLGAVDVTCRIEAAAAVLRCRDGTARIGASPYGPAQARFELRVQRDAQWSVPLLRLQTEAGLLRAALRSEAGALDLEITAQRLQLQTLAGWARSAGHSLPVQLAGTLEGTVRARLENDGAIGLQRVDLQLRELDVSEPSGALATEDLQVAISGSAWRSGGAWAGWLALRSREGQAYIEPIYADLSQTPITGTTRFAYPTAEHRLTLEGLELTQSGVLALAGHAVLSVDGLVDGLGVRQAELQARGADLGALARWYLQPLLAATPVQDLGAAGAWSVAVSWDDGPQALSLELDAAAFSLPRWDAALHGLHGRLQWKALAPAPLSQLRWTDAALGELPIGGAALHFRMHGRSFSLLQPLFVPILGGGLAIDKLQLGAVGTPQMDARFTARVLPIDLATLGGALGWPAFGGSLSGELPALALRDGVLRLRGGLDVRAFDGLIRVEQLRVLEPFGRLPRLVANLRLDNLELAQITQAFEVGRIEGRIEGEIADLRLLDWHPVAFRAQLQSPRHDASRRRISQRAVDSIASLGGGAPGGVLSRTALRFFDEFRYARLGISAVLEDEVCEVNGIAAADNGGFVLVAGRGLPRIEVIGYNHRVDWPTFMEQLRALQNTEEARIE